MCFLSCSLDSPPAPQFLSWGHSLPGALGAGRLVLLLCPPRPLSHRALQGQLWGDTGPAPPCPLALTPTSISSGRICRLPQKSPLAGKRQQNTAHFSSSGPSRLCLPPRSRGGPGQAVSPPPAVGISPGRGPAPARVVGHQWAQLLSHCWQPCPHAVLSDVLRSHLLHR